MTTSNMLTVMTNKVLGSQIEFFDKNPVGRILTRFSKDMAVLDIVVPPISIVMTYGAFRAITVAISIMVVNFWLIIPGIISLAYLYYLMTRATKAMIETQRVDTVARGPVHNLFVTMTGGLISIRALDQCQFFIDNFLKESDYSANVTWTYGIANRWLGVRFDMVILILSCSCAITSVFMRGLFETTLLIFSLQVITDVTALFSIAMRFFTEM